MQSMQQTIHPIIQTTNQTNKQTDKQKKQINCRGDHVLFLVSQLVFYYEIFQ